ncbi:IS1/IS1595 family N-terminal zinc-binding domain-containing protein [Enorma phocaeensis]|uniref:IS1/IS1595 family N-terminal zinc-binding domain-containing protein n=1 Tax=Enorma phocaeensis TaxID=1871019 RepID=UPI003F50BAC1
MARGPPGGGYQTQAVSCPSCGAKMKRNGKTGAGAQRWGCGSCGASTTLSCTAPAEGLDPVARPTSACIRRMTST